MCNSKAKEWFLRQVAFAEILDDLDTEFAKMGVEYMPIKGAYLIRSGIAEKLAERHMVDIDILVRRKDFERVLQYLDRSDKAQSRKSGWPFDSNYSYTAGGHECLLEIKYLTGAPARFQIDTDALFERSSRPGARCRMPRPHDALLIAICHALTHLHTSFDVGIFEEMGLIIDLPGFDWDMFWTHARHSGVTHFIGMVLEAFGEHSGRSVPVHGATAYSRWFSRRMVSESYRSRPALFRRLAGEMVFARSPVELVLNKARGLVSSGRDLKRDNQGRLEN